MATVNETVEAIVQAPTWDQRVAQIRLVSQRHGTAEHSRIFADVAREAYVPHLAPDFAYIHEAPFYEAPYFRAAYVAAAAATSDFTVVDETTLSTTITDDPRTLLVFRTILGLTKAEFAQATVLVAEATERARVSADKIDSLERNGTTATPDQATTIAQTLTQIMDGSLFGDPGGGLRSKQAKIDTENGWSSASNLATTGVPYADFLHQRHYGGAYRQVLDATSTKRGNLIEDAVEQLFLSAGVPYIRTGAHDQAEIARRFELQVQPAPDFVIFDDSGSLRGILECKLVNDGGTARDKALRFERLRGESIRLGGIPLFAVLSGMGWTRVNDTLGPVVRDTEGRVFTLATLGEILTVAPLPTLVNTMTMADAEISSNTSDT
ncbi:hypothetical protein [Arthrobacter sp. YAF16]|uniref:hypothetical protein n=1 Tax=Arthrobacter sp. YAF16 TaxID=3233076 RepID=UPI003F933A57